MIPSSQPTAKHPQRWGVNCHPEPGPPFGTVVRDLLFPEEVRVEQPVSRVIPRPAAGFADGAEGSAVRNAIALRATVFGV